MLLLRIAPRLPPRIIGHESNALHDLLPPLPEQSFLLRHALLLPRSIQRAMIPRNFLLLPSPPRVAHDASPDGILEAHHRLEQGGIIDAQFRQRGVIDGDPPPFRCGQQPGVIAGRLGFSHRWRIIIASIVVDVVGKYCPFEGEDFRTVQRLHETEEPFSGNEPSPVLVQDEEDEFDHVVLLEHAERANAVQEFAVGHGVQVPRPDQVKHTV
mmetsp:Transcript_38813/g.93372  ORF Transcript_38813/g.93372 Transcript_38813/m.93372 type:complete len:212 (-) Transcript_38813:173-808(-)